MNRIVKISLLAVGGLALLALNYLVMSTVFFGPTAVVKAALKNDAVLHVTERQGGDWLIFNPAAQTATVGLIMYPENYQDIRMYAPISRRIASQGYLFVLLSRRDKFPPTFEEEELRIADVMASFPDVKTWFIGAHTFDGGIAAAYANRHADKLAGVVLWAGRLSAETSLAGSKLPVLMIYGTADDQKENIAAYSRPLLPPQTVWVVIEGGNRVNFANFGPLPGDATATISLDKQQAQAADATLKFMADALK